MMKNPAAQLQVIQSSPFRGELDNNLAKGQVALWWLGQAGFALQYGGRILLIDPYLSDLLARKYRDHMFSHERMMPTPIEGTDLRQVDWVLCTHRHSDHMDPGLLPDLAKSHPECRFILPAAEREHALGLGLPEGQLILMNDGMSLELDQAIKVRAIAAAHEELKTNERGEHHFLGYVIECGDLSIFHSGDGVPYDGLEERLASIPIDLALLPVNGRTPELRRARFLPEIFRSKNRSI